MKTLESQNLNPEFIRDYLAARPELAHPKLPDDYHQLVLVGLTKGGISESIWGQEVASFYFSIRSKIHFARKIFVDYHALANGASNAIAVVTDKQIPEDKIANFMQNLRNVSVPFVVPTRDMMFDGGAFTLRVSFEGTKMEVQTFDPPPPPFVKLHSLTLAFLKDMQL